MFYEEGNCCCRLSRTGTSDFAAFEGLTDPSASQSSASGLPVKKGGGDPEKPRVKRTKLRHYDLAPAQCLNPTGVSYAANVDSPKFWDLCCKGSTAAMYFSELRSKEEELRLVGLSRTAEVIEEAIKKLESDKKYLTVILKPEICKAVYQEAGPRSNKGLQLCARVGKFGRAAWAGDHGKALG